MTTRLEDESLSADGCFWWLTEWNNCPSHTIAGLVELYEQLIPTRVYMSQKTHSSAEGEVICRPCGKAPERVAHIPSGCSALAQSKYLSRHDAALKVLFYELLYDEGLIDEIRPGTHRTSPNLCMSHRTSRLTGMSLSTLSNKWLGAVG